ncbi:hypothetical protein [Fibrobacter sp. UWH4]|uniref:phage baseplate plug family protein n=1 Tax=Fibrobacter sp. UWH4 TaxID=1896210 RepID=UPI000912CA24|nr:hypothetical protein [Fibrobacter sp. UWH4]SHL04665.1 hypothetical protein SAMN05720762_10453 [Fibrobacter sp. UWH4]
MVEIPIETNGVAYMTESVNVGGVSLSIRLLWNGRDSRWYADLESVDGKNDGVAFMVNTPLLSSKNKCLVDGDLVIVQSVTGVKATLGFDNLGKEFSLIYLTKAEVDEFVEALLSMNAEAV